MLSHFIYEDEEDLSQRPDGTSAAPSSSPSCSGSSSLCLPARPPVRLVDWWVAPWPGQESTTHMVMACRSGSAGDPRRFKPSSIHILGAWFHPFHSHGAIPTFPFFWMHVSVRCFHPGQCKHDIPINIPAGRPHETFAFGAVHANSKTLVKTKTFLRRRNCQPGQAKENSEPQY